MTRRTAVLVCLLAAAAPAGADWPLVWDFDGRNDVPVDAARADVGGDLWILVESYSQGSVPPRAVLLRVTPAGDVAWQVDDPGMTSPQALALAPDGRALLFGQVGTTQRVTAVGSDGAIGWSRERSGVSTPFFSHGDFSRPIWDAAASAWRVPAGLDGDFLIASFTAAGDELPDLLWSPPAGEAVATSVRPRVDGGVLVAGTLSEVGVPGWWVVALDASGTEIWSRFEDGGTIAGIFSGAYLLDGDPVRVWADDETMCGLFSLRLWALDPIDGAPLWAETWPAAGGCGSFVPHSVVLAGDRIVAVGPSDDLPATSGIATVALAFDGATGDPIWERAYDGATTTLSTAVASDDGSAHVVSSLFPVPQPGPTPLWLSAWNRDGQPCAPPQPLLPSRVAATFVDAAGWRVLGYDSPGATATDLVVQRIADPCAALFADGFESGDTAAWSAIAPRPPGGG